MQDLSAGQQHRGIFYCKDKKGNKNIETFKYNHNNGYYNYNRGYKMDLIDFLKQNKKEARKIFGEKELEIIERQMKGINLTQSEKNRLSKDIRKKLEFIKEISRFSGEFGLKKGAETRKIIEEALEIILNNKLRNKIKEIWLFGSFVKKELTFRSDIDIAVIFTEINKSKATEFRIKVSGSLPERVDIQVFNILPEKVKMDILKNHRVIYKNERYNK